MVSSYGFFLEFIYIIIIKRISLFDKLILRRSLIGISVGTFHQYIKFFNYTNKNGGPHLHHSPNLTEPH